MAVVITAYVLVIASLISLAVSIFVDGKPRRALVFLGVALVVSAGIMVLVELGLNVATTDG